MIIFPLFGESATYGINFHFSIRVTDRFSFWFPIVENVQWKSWKWYVGIVFAILSHYVGMVATDSVAWWDFLGIYIYTYTFDCQKFQSHSWGMKQYQLSQPLSINEEISFVLLGRFILRSSEVIKLAAKYLSRLPECNQLVYCFLLFGTK